MRITFDGMQANHPAEQMTIKQGTAQVDRMSMGRGFALDISGKVMDNNAYEGHGKTAEEVMQQMGAIDVPLMRDYLTVMSNSMSADDFEKMSKDGFDPTAMSGKDSVTILDHIKAAMIQGGAVVEGFTTDVDADTLRDITGSEVFAGAMLKELHQADVPCDEKQAEEIGKAFTKASAIKEPDEAAAKYMVENRILPTIDGLYQAEYSASGNGNRQGRGFYADDVSGYYSRKADRIDLEALKPQLQKTIEDAGLPADEQTMKEAGWLVEKGIPLTTDALNLLHQIDSMQFPPEEQVVAKAIASAIADGRKPGKANLADPSSNLEKAENLAREVQSFTPELTDRVAEKGKELTIRNLRAEAASVSPEMTAGRMDEAMLSEKQLQARTVLARTQLIMTTQANLKLLESGFSIETKSLEELVGKLEEATQMISESLWKTDDSAVAEVRKNLYQETVSVLSEIPFVPVDVLGQIATDDTPVTLQRIHTEGTILKERYDMASHSYETMMTAPRTDLGDSIQKAFRNVDDLLKDLELEPNELNRRAVRILGYNRMEITREEVETVKETDAALRSLIKKMTPAVTLELVRAGKNPLTMSVRELDEEVDKLPITAQNKEQSLGKFLYRLDQKGEITEQERETCIGIFRLFRQIEKKDDAAVGSVLRDGRDLTLANLLSEMRASRKKGMDYTVDDTFGGLDVKDKGVTITEQIESAFYYRNLAGEAVSEANPEAILRLMQEKKIQTPEDLTGSETTLEQMIGEILGEEEILPDLIRQEEKEFQLHVLDEMKAAAAVSEETIGMLLEMDVTMSPQMLLAMEQLSNTPELWFSQLYKKSNSGKSTEGDSEQKPLPEEVKRAAATTADAMETADASTVKESYKEMLKTMAENAPEADSYLDLRLMQSSMRQISILGKMAERERYDIPVTIEGEDALIHLTLRRGEDVKGQLDIYFETEYTGRVAARFHVGNVNGGYVLCESMQGKAWLESKAEKLNALASGDVEVLFAENIHMSDFTNIQKTEQTADNHNSEVTNRQLYQMAGRFLKILQEQL